MHNRMLLAGALALALSAPHARAASDADLDEIRAQIRDLKDGYEARIKALEDRLKDAEAKAAEAKAEAASRRRPAARPVAAAPELLPPPVASAAPSSPSSSLAAFNPAISAILKGQYTNFSQDPDKFRLSGFAPARRHRSRQARLQPRRIRARVLGQRRRQVRRQPDLLAHAR